MRWKFLGWSSQSPALVGCIGMGRPGPDLEPGPMALGPICEAIGRPNLSLACGLVDPVSMMG